MVPYNVPGRTGSNIEAETTLRLAKLPNIIGIKEASGNMSQVQKILAMKPKNFEVLSGDDGLTFPMLALGASGVISVASNCCPRIMTQMVELCLKEKFIDASALHYKMMPLFTHLFIESNPIPIKYVMKKLGYGNGIPRLPLTPLSAESRMILDKDLIELGLI